MSKISIDIENVKNSLCSIGYEISDCIERENNGLNWQLKFSNSGAVVTIYDTNNKKNSVVNGKLEDNEGIQLKDIIDKIKCKELYIDKLNNEIIKLINLHKENHYYDYKQEMHKNMEDFLHDILCLSNNIENRDAYLIFGVTDNYEVIGIDKELESNNIFDFLGKQKFAGNHRPDIEVKNLYYKYKKIAVIVCKSSKHVPFYLMERCRKVNPNQIYTRVGDTNTPINEHASYSDIETLWRFHFEKQ